MNYYGIDLGTSSCLVAKVSQNLDDTFEVKCLTDNDGEDSFPSVVHFNNDKEYKVGYSAMKYLYDNSDSTIELIKVRLGKTDFINIKTPENIFWKSPQEITSYLLTHLNSIHNREITNAVITVPAFFDQSQKNATMQAGIIAGMTPKLLIEEPTAAIMYHIYSEYKKNGFDFFDDKIEKNILVFDFGGGTLDLSLIQIIKKENEVIPQVLAIGGDAELGGNIIDFIFINVILIGLRSKYIDDDFINDVFLAYQDYYLNYINNNVLHFSDVVTEQIKQFIFRLKRNLEQVKIKLSTQESVTIIFEGIYKPMPFTREHFERYVLSSEELNVQERIKDALDKISKKRIKVNEVLLIGGSSQIPYIKDVIVEVFQEMGVTKNRIILSDDFDKAVAKGAAIQSAIVSGIAIEPFMHNKCDSIVARDIELEHAGNHQVFISMGTEYPFKEKKKFVMKIGHALSEAVSLKLNELIVKNDSKESREICQFEFFLPLYYTNDDVIIHMNIDEAGLYQIEAIHSATQEAAEFESHKRYTLSDNLMKKVIENAKEMTDIS